MNAALIFSILCAGFAAMAGQIIFLRELLIVFSGNELAIGLVLACWLLAGGAGSLLFAALSKRYRMTAAFPFLQMAAGISLPLGIYLCGMMRPWLGFVPGEIVPFALLTLASFLAVLPFCAASGFMFGLACRLYQNAPGREAGAVYALEAAGSLIGGLAVSLVLLRSFSALEIACILGAVSCAAAAVMLSTCRARYRCWFPGTLAAILILLVFSGGCKKLETISIAARWPGYSVSFNASSIYGTTTVLKRGDQVSFLTNGLLAASVPDPASAEEGAHFALLEHPHPKTVLLIGGITRGIVGEVLKHPVATVDCLELDPLLVRAAREFLPREMARALDDPRVAIQNVDGRSFVKNTRRSYDCVIISLGEPYTALINRYYTRDFFRKLKKVMNDGAVVSFNLAASENYLNSRNRDFLACVYATLKSSFPQVIVIPGENAHFVAGVSGGGLTTDYRVLMERSRERGLVISYVREYYLASLMTPAKMDWLKGELQKSGGVKENRDFLPTAYYYGLISWYSRFRNSILPAVLSAANRALAPLLAALIAAMLAGRVLLRPRKAGGLLPLAVMGFSSTALQVVLMFAFQVLHGYLFFEMGKLFTCFMAGLALGSGWMNRSGKRPPLGLLFTASALFYACLPLMFSRVPFIALSLFAGLLAGAQFSAAARAYSIGREEEKAAGISYAADLTGACLGAALTGVFFIPVIGVVGTCLFLAALNCVILKTC